jgi:hypothetical protein
VQLVLRNQAESFERTADELRTVASRGAGFGAYRRDVEALMATLVAQFNVVGQAVWRAQDSPEGLSPADAALVHAFFIRLSKTFDEVLTYGRAVERSGHAVSGKDEFLTTWRELKGIAAVDAARRSAPAPVGGVSLADLSDELSRDLRR